MRPRALLAHLRAHAAAYLVLAVGLATTTLVRFYVVSAVDAQRRARFEEHAAAAQDAIRNRMEAYVATLRATAGLFTAGTEPSREQFRVFVETLQLDAHYPGIQGIGFAQLIVPSEVAQHEQAVRAEGFPGYRVWPESTGEWRSAIVYLEPADWRNERALGFDMFSEPVRREAMLRALETRQATSTAALELVQEVGRERQPGFLIYQPVFSRSAPEDAQRGVVLGFVFAPFRVRDLLDATLPQDALGPHPPRGLCQRSPRSVAAPVRVAGFPGGRERSARPRLRRDGGGQSVDASLPARAGLHVPLGALAPALDPRRRRPGESAPLSPHAR